MKRDLILVRLSALGFCANEQSFLRQRCREPSGLRALERLGRKQQRENVDRDEKQSLVEDGLREACFFSLSCGCALH